MFQPDAGNERSASQYNPGSNADAAREPAEKRDAFPDETDAHLVGTGVGAVSGGATGAAIGATAGPVGAVIGAAVGGVVGGLIGKGVAEGVRPSVEHKYWQTHFSDRPYVPPGSTYEAYGPAYQYGWESCSKYPDCDFEDIEPELRRDWETYGHDRNLAWNQAREAIRDAWNKIRAATIGPSRRHDSGY